MAARHDDTGDAPDRGDPRDDEIAERWAEIIADLGPLGTDPSTGTETGMETGTGTDPVTGTRDRPAAASPGDVGSAEPGPDEAGPGRRTPEPGRREPGASGFPVAPWVSTGPRELSGRDWAGTDDIDAAEAEVDDRDHFVPPEPGPVLGGDPLLTMAWLGAAGIPIGLVVVLIFWRDAPTVVLQSAGVVFLLSCLLLVWRMPHHRDESDDGPGAVV